MAFNQAIADAVCDMLQDGKSLRAACEAVGTTHSTIIHWTKENTAFLNQYTRAREIGYKLLADEIIDIADEKEVQVRYDGEDTTLDLSPTAIARNRLRVDTRKWMLSKMLPKIYGDKLELSGDADKPVEVVHRINLTAL
jgi:hypothetical protein